MYRLLLNQLQKQSSAIALAVGVALGTATSPGKGRWMATRLHKITASCGNSSYLIWLPFISSRLWNFAVFEAEPTAVATADMLFSWLIKSIMLFELQLF